jgi:predicted metal-dependent peptidase
VTPGSDQQVLREVSQAVSRMLMGSRTFYGHVLVRMRREVSRSVPTMAVRLDSDGVTLVVNPDFWRQTLVTDDFREGVLVHEVLHVVLQHLVRAREHRDRERFNVAAYLVVNRLVGKRFLPQGALLIEDMPPEISELEDGTVEQYYELLGKQRDRQADESPGGGFDSPTRGSHDTWPGTDGSGPAVPEGVMRSALSGLVQAAARDTRATRGTIPAGLERAIAAATPRRTRTDWRRMLHLFGTSGTTTYLKPTIMSPSRRFGTVPGVRVRQRQALAVAVDTSGSIDDDLLSAFFSEVHALWRLGVDVTVIECDAEIEEGGVWKYQGRFARRSTGGGGTDFDAPIAWANRNPVDGLVYLTDGDGGRSVPCRRRLLWMVTDESNVRDSSGFARPGEAVCHLDVSAVHAR